MRQNQELAQKDLKIKKLETYIKDLEIEKHHNRKDTIELDMKYFKTEQKLTDLSSTLQNVLIQLHKIKDEHLSLKKDLVRVEKENEFYKDKNGIDLNELTPRPDWNRMKLKYPVEDLYSGENL